MLSNRHFALAILTFLVLCMLLLAILTASLWINAGGFEMTGGHCYRLSEYSTLCMRDAPVRYAPVVNPTTGVP